MKYLTLVFLSVLSFSVTAFPYCNDETVFIDRFEDREMSNLLLNGYFQLEEPGLEWSISGDYQTTTWSPKNLTVVSPISGTTGDGGTVTIAQTSFPSTGIDSKVCVAVKTEFFTAIGGVPPDITIIIIQSGPSPVFTKTFSNGTGEGVVHFISPFPDTDFSGFTDIQIAIDWNTIPADEQSAVSFKFVKMSYYPRPGNLMTTTQ